MSDRTISIIRTGVPVLWTTFLAWLVSLGVPGGLAEMLSGVGVLLVPVAVTVVYAAQRWLEPRLPRWLAAVLLGSSRQPLYPTP